jgi:membrane protein YdbS with pleckstrin-like domain
MPLIACPDCGRQVSTSAPNCPQCGRPIAAGFAAVPLAAPPAQEQTLWQGVPSLKAMMLEIALTTLYAVGLPIAAILIFGPLLDVLSGFGKDAARFVATNRSSFQLVLTLVVVFLIATRAAKLAWRAVALRSHRYRVSNQRILLETGVFSKRIDEVDMRTVEDIEFRQNVFQRLLGIGDIAILAADKQMGRFRLLGVEKPRDLRELIRSTAYQATRGQLFTRNT